MKNTNEILFHRHIKNVVKHGVSRHEAREIVETAIEAGNGKDVEMYITYALTLKYGLPRRKVTI